MNCLLDSDFLFALFKPDDSNHKKAKYLLKRYFKENFYISNLVVQESTTLVARRMGMKYAKHFYYYILRMVKKVIVVDLGLEQEGWNIFLAQTKKGTSFIDCANLTVVKKYKLNGILSFDEFYPKKVKVR